MNNINNKIAINKAINQIKSLYEKYSDEYDGDFSRPIDYVFEDNSAGYMVQEILTYFLDFYERLNREEAFDLEKKLEKVCNLSIESIYDLAKQFNYRNNGASPEGSNDWINHLYESVKTKSTNKYVEAFREAVEKLQEDDGNPSVTQVIDYDMDNEEVDYYNSGLKEVNDTLTKAKDDLEKIIWNKYKHNKKLNKALDKLEDLIYYLFNEFAYKSPTNNEYVGSGFVDGLGSDDYATWDIANVDHAHYK